MLAARPDIPINDYRQRGRRLGRRSRRLDAWKEGLTGYPIVDAGMRQLASRAFMPNRARLIVASFLTKTLEIDWRGGAAHFERLLVDADLANNTGNWQWVAGTGNDTRPEPGAQPDPAGRRFDPEGAYVRRFVPELAPLEGRAIHEPWKADPASASRARLPGAARALRRLALGGRRREPSQEPPGHRPVDALLGLRVHPDADPCERAGAAEPRIEVLDLHADVDAAAPIRSIGRRHGQPQRSHGPAPRARPGSRA